MKCDSIKSFVRIICLLLFILVFPGFFTTISSQEITPIQFEYVDPLEKVLAEASYFRPKEAISEVVRGENASLQFVVRSTDNITNLKVHVSTATNSESALPPAKKGFVGYVKVGRSIWDYSRDRIVSYSGYYPDPILEQESIDVVFGNAQPIWISVPIPKDAKPGLYNGKVTITGKNGKELFSISKNYSIKVYPVTIEETSLWVTNWFTLDADRLKWMNDGVPFEPFSDKYWRCVDKLAKKMAEYRQNIALISPLDLSEFKFENNKWTIDFSNFDKTVELFIREGVIGKIEGGHIGTRESHWTSQFVVFVPNEKKDPQNKFDKLPISAPRAKRFYTDFFDGLMNHLKEKGWDKIYVQHIADEPIEENVETYTEISRFVKQAAPELLIIEACHSKNLDNIIDIWVPQLDFMNKDYSFYNEQNKNGKEAWFYTCLAPKGEYANRFIELPLLKTRFVHWLNFKYKIPGYLHWGLNYWTANGNPLDEQTSINHEGGNILPGGDSWIIYPKDGNLLSSIRFDAMRDGIVDYELFKMLEKKNPETAKSIIDKVIYGFDKYDNNVEQFRKNRRDMMELLSK
ncbi:MAG: DUF4091 domain-containing protein [Bacteroidales bacterium]|jgi:hypothetical protein|nr:DUF4091 domain-containing protein [Bacteroidales bacterium]